MLKGKQRMRGNRGLVSVGLILGVCLFRQEVRGESITLPELRAAVANCWKQIETTARIVYIAQETSNAPPYEAQGSDTDKGWRLAMNGVFRAEVIIDAKNKRAKTVTVDLRDVNALLAQNALPQTSKPTVSRTRTIIVGRGYDLMFYDKEVWPGSPQVVLTQRFAEAIYPFDLLRFGLITVDLLDDDKNPQLSEIDSGTGKLIRVHIPDSNREPAIIEATFDLDPSLGYRCRTIHWYRDGRPWTEVIADNYKDVNGVFFPFTYTQRWFDKERGGLLTENVYQIASAEFGTALGPDDFQVFAPAGTQFMHDTELGVGSGPFAVSRHIGIDEALRLARMDLERP